MSIRYRTWTTGGTERSAWVVDYRDQAGTRRLKTFKTRSEAEEARTLLGVANDRAAFEARCAYVQHDLATRRAYVARCWLTESK